tara:strand:- start:156063 stop:156317 length:255 start_codon:yes stop_codon:yes gene_type:complete
MAILFNIFIIAMIVFFLVYIYHILVNESIIKQTKLEYGAKAIRPTKILYSDHNVSNFRWENYPNLDFVQKNAIRMRMNKENKLN